MKGLKKSQRLGLLGLVLSVGFANVAFAEESKPRKGSEIFEESSVAPLALDDNPYAALRWRWPTTKSIITGEYGERRSDGKHKGIDIGVYKENVYAVADGEVVKAGKFSDGAKVVAILHDDEAENGNQLLTRYIHLDKYSVSRGDLVERGDKIGVSGNTGGVGYHLHFDINDDEDITPSYSDTLNPAYFWPNKDLTMSSFQELDAKHDHDHDHEEEDSKYSDPENYFDQILIDYVGEDKFEEWFNSLPESERKLSNFKDYFGISEKEEKQIIEKGIMKNKEKSSKKK